MNISELARRQGDLAVYEKQYKELGKSRAIKDEAIRRVRAEIALIQAEGKTRWAEVPIDTPIEARRESTSEWELYNFGAYIPKFTRPFITFQRGEKSGEAQALKSFKFARLYRQGDIEKYVDYPEACKFKNFTEGQKIWCKRFGYGRVSHTNDNTHFPVIVLFDKLNKSLSFTVEGYWSPASGANRRIEKVYE